MSWNNAINLVKTKQEGYNKRHHLAFEIREKASFSVDSISEIPILGDVLSAVREHVPKFRNMKTIRNIDRVYNI